VVQLVQVFFKLFRKSRKEEATRSEEERSQLLNVWKKGEQPERLNGRH
jgi:hypothetical protein